MFKDGDCVICQGHRTVRLPVYHPASMVPVNVAIPDSVAREFPRSYPCPECSPAADVVKTVQGRRAVRAEIFDEALDFVRSEIARSISSTLIDRGFIEFSDRVIDFQDGFPRKEVIGTLAVVSIEHRKALDERIAEHQAEVARKVAEDASIGIRRWGSYYGQNVISKADALREIGSALAKVVKRKA
jgi:hypothetical protein